ncbi:ATP-binding cassette sub-family C member 2-like [Ixodes scapularis]
MAVKVWPKLGDDPYNKNVNPGLRSRTLSVNDSWPTKGQIEFQEYSASYRPGDLPDALKGVTFSVQSYEKVGVVGRTGAGKSSLVLALLRVLKASQGRITIDSVDITQVPLKRLRSAITVIPQDPILVRGSLRDNLDPTGTHTDEELWDALQKSHLDEFVSKHPQRLLLDTGDGGANLSVGQRQLACLARALIRRPQVLILDEATSQVDGDTDRLIQATLRQSFGKCTVMAIAHKIHTVLDYDKILVMGDGRVMEYGPVAELLSNPATMFSSMVQSAGVAPPPDNRTRELYQTKL